MASPRPWSASTGANRITGRSRLQKIPVQPSTFDGYWDSLVFTGCAKIAAVERYLRHVVDCD